MKIIGLIIIFLSTLAHAGQHPCRQEAHREALLRTVKMDTVPMGSGVSFRATNFRIIEEGRQGTFTARIDVENIFAGTTTKVIIEHKISGQVMPGQYGDRCEFFPDAN